MSGEQLFATRHMCEGLALSYLSDLTISRRQLKEKLPRTKDRDHLRRSLEYRGQRIEHRGRSLEHRGTNNHTEGEIRVLWTTETEGQRPEADIHSKDDGSFSQRGI